MSRYIGRQSTVQLGAGPAVEYQPPGLPATSDWLVDIEPNKEYDDTYKDKDKKHNTKYPTCMHASERF